MPIQQNQQGEPPKKPRDIQQRAKTLTDDAGELFDLFYKLAVLTATQKASNAASISITVIFILFLLMFTLLFAGLGIGWYLGEKFNSMLVGYGIVASVFALLIGLTLALRKNVVFPYIRNNIVKKVYE
jgi:hypothetical protein